MDARKPLAVLTAQRRRMATGSFNFTMPYAYNKQTVLFAKKYRLYYYCQFHESFLGRQRSARARERALARSRAPKFRKG